MIEIAGSIESVSGRSVTVHLASRSGCGACDIGRGCGLGPLLTLFARGGPRRVRVPVAASVPLVEGDRVRFAISNGRLAGLAAAAYGLPLLGLMLGAAIANTILPDAADLATAGGAAAGAALAWLGLRLAGFDRGLRGQLQRSLRRSP